jgi:hemoglobin-like flavoprotein
VTPEQLDLVRRTGKLVEEAGDRFAGHFYDCLFALHPTARDLFPTDLDAERGNLVNDVMFLAAAADDLPAFLGRARDLGQEYRYYGVVAADYQAVGEALVCALGDVVGPSWSAEAAEAWRRIYTLIVETMLEGAAADLFKVDDGAPAT